MPELVSLPIGILEVTMEYVRPRLSLLMDRSKIVDELFERYRSWGITVDDLEVIAEGKPSEQGIRFKLPRQKTTFFFSSSLCRLTQDDSSWESASDTMAILSTGVDVLQNLANVEIGSYKTSIALHVQPKTRQAIDILHPFVPHLLSALESGQATALALVVRWSGRRLTIDGSSQIANGIFIRTERQFDAEADLAELAG